MRAASWPLSLWHSRRLVSLIFSVVVGGSGTGPRIFISRLFGWKTLPKGVRKTVESGKTKGKHVGLDSAAQHGFRWCVAARRHVCGGASLLADVG